MTELNKEVAIFGAGCFWCIEAIYDQLKGVSEVLPGYTGGQIKNPGYREVCTGRTGHAEVAKITFDPAVISYKELLEVFWKIHDPTTLNRQGNDVGTQYRSAIYYTNDEQKKLAEGYKEILTDKNVFDAPIVTEITSLGPFYEAEIYHKDYFAKHGEESYCQFVVRPKVEKFKKAFAEKLK